MGMRLDIKHGQYEKNIQAVKAEKVLKMKLKAMERGLASVL